MKILTIIFWEKEIKSKSSNPIVFCYMHLILMQYVNVFPLSYFYKIFSPALLPDS